MGVGQRLSKLIKNDVIKIQALLNVGLLDLSAAIVLIEIDGPEPLQKLLDRFERCPRVVHIFKTLGGYNLLGIVVAEDKDTLESISIEKCSLRSNPGIRRSEFYPIGQIHYSQYLPIREELTHTNNEVTPCKVKCETCWRFKAEKCVGCPTIADYRGNL